VCFKKKGNIWGKKNTMVPWWVSFLRAPTVERPHPRPKETPATELNSFFARAGGWDPFYLWCRANKILLHLDKTSASQPFLFVDLPEGPIFVFDLKDRDLKGLDLNLEKSFLKIMECAAKVRPKADCAYEFLDPKDFKEEHKEEEEEVKVAASQDSRARLERTRPIGRARVRIPETPRTVSSPSSDSVTTKRHGRTLTNVEQDKDKEDDKDEEEEKKYDSSASPYKSMLPALPSRDPRAVEQWNNLFFIRLRYILLEPGEQIIAKVKVSKTHAQERDVFLTSHRFHISQNTVESTMTDKYVCSLMVEKKCSRMGFAPAFSLFRQNQYNYACKRDAQFHQFSLKDFLQSKAANPKDFEKYVLFQLGEQIRIMQEQSLSHGNLSLTNILIVPGGTGGQAIKLMWRNFSFATLSNIGILEYVIFAKNFELQKDSIPPTYWAAFIRFFESKTRRKYLDLLTSNITPSIDRNDYTIDWSLFETDQDLFLRSFLRHYFHYQPRRDINLQFQLTAWGRDLMDNPWVFSQSNNRILKIGKNKINLHPNASDLSVCDELRYEILMHRAFLKASRPGYNMAPKLYNWKRYLVDKKFEVVVFESEKITTLIELLGKKLKQRTMDLIFERIADYFIKMCLAGLWHMDAHVGNWGWIKHGDENNFVLFDYAHASIHPEETPCDWSYDFMELPRSLKEYYLRRHRLKLIADSNWPLIVNSLRKCLEILRRVEKRTWLPPLPPADVTDVVTFFDSIFDLAKDKQLLSGTRRMTDAKRLAYVEAHWTGDSD
jgi:hypothetical protein